MVDSRQLEADAMSAALRALAQDYENINWSHFRSQLEPAPLMWDEGSNRLGHWATDPRGIALSRDLVFGQPWGIVLEVLKHEMAHQFVDEVLRVREQPAHGPAFQDVCARLGIDARASGLPRRESATGSGILQRIANLLALAGSPNPHEAQTAMRTAHRLMLKHNLAAAPSQASDYGFRHLGQPTGRSSEAERALASLLGEFFFVQPIWVSVFRPEDQKRVNVLEVTGRHDNLAMAEYVYDFLLHAAEALWRQHKRARQIKRNTQRRAYCAGVIRGFADKLRAERQSQRSEGLIWVGDPQADHHFRRRHPRVQTTRSGSSDNTVAAEHGREAGKRLVLNRPLEGGTQTRGRLLTRGT